MVKLMAVSRNRRPQHLLFWPRTLSSLSPSLS